MTWFTLLQLNILRDAPHTDWEARQPILEHLIRSTTPSIMTFQEVETAPSEQIRIDSRQLSFLKETFPDHLMIGEGTENIIILRQNRFIVRRSGIFWLSETPERQDSISWGNSTPRSVTWAEVEDRASHRRGPKRFLIMTTHLDRLAFRSKRRSVDLILSKIASLQTDLKADIPVIITGDLNSFRWSRQLRRLEESYEDAFGHITGRSYLHRGIIPLRIDYVFISVGIEARDQLIVETGVSDHRALIGEFRIR